MRKNLTATIKMMHLFFAIICIVLLSYGTSMAQQENLKRAKEITSRDFIEQNPGDYMVKYYIAFPDNEFAKQAIENEVILKNIEANPHISFDGADIVRTKSAEYRRYFEIFSRLVLEGKDELTAHQRAASALKSVQIPEFKPEQ